MSTEKNLKTLVIPFQQEQRILKLTESICIVINKIMGGTFIIGINPEKDPLSYSNEYPEHPVTLQEYWIGKYPITNAQYQLFTQETNHLPPIHWVNKEIPSGLENHPVTFVNWKDAISFCTWLTKKVNLNICLPSEAEWEIAARGIISTFDQSVELVIQNDTINYDRSFLDRGTTSVGRFSSQGDNLYGCSDMLGNVWEWTNDWYDHNYYSVDDYIDPLGPKVGVCRVIRGGAWIDDIQECRPTNRQGLTPRTRNAYTGFRCCISKSHSNEIDPFGEIHSQVNKAIFQKNWSIASYLIDKLASFSDDEVHTLQAKISEGKHHEYKLKLLEILNIRVMELRISEAVAKEDWDQVIILSKELIAIQPYDRIANEASLVTQKHLGQQKMLMLRAILCSILDLRRLDLEIENLMKNQDWQKAQGKVNEYILKNGKSDKTTKIIGLIESGLKFQRTEAVGQNRKANVPEKSLQEKFDKALSSEDWQTVIRLGEEWINEGPNIYVASAIEKAKKNLVPPQSTNGNKSIRFHELQNLTDQAIIDNKLIDAFKFASEWQKLDPIDQRPKNALVRIKLLMGEKHPTPLSVSVSPDDIDDLLKKFKAAVSCENWDQIVIFGEEWIRLNTIVSQKSPSDSQRGPFWKQFSHTTINLAKSRKLLHAVFVGSLAIYYSPNEQSIELILNNIWKEYSKKSGTTLTKQQLTSFVQDKKWYELLSLLQVSLSGIKEKRVVPTTVKQNPQEEMKQAQTIPVITQNHIFPNFNSNTFLIQKASNKQSVSIELLPKISINFIPVTGGSSYIGGWPADQLNHKANTEEFPASTIHLSNYWISECPITFSQFALFIERTGYMTNAERTNSGYTRINQQWGDYPGVSWRHPFGVNAASKDKSEHPVTMVSWHDAIEFCKWLIIITNFQISLPTEAEWERAARGNQTVDFPWGSMAPSPLFCNFGNSLTGDTSPVNKNTGKGQSSFECKDMAGNVWEWTNSLYRQYPYIATDGREDPISRGNRVIRGGAFISQPKDLRCSARKQMEPEKQSSFIGFRIVIRPTKE